MCVRGDAVFYIILVVVWEIDQLGLGLLEYDVVVFLTMVTRDEVWREVFAIAAVEVAATITARAYEYREAMLRKGPLILYFLAEPVEIQSANISSFEVGCGVKARVVGRRDCQCVSIGEYACQS
jgi:hypothetical protein